MTWSVMIRAATAAAALSQLEASFAAAVASQKMHAADLPAIGKMVTEVIENCPLKEGHDQLIQGSGSMHYDYDGETQEFTPTGMDISLRVLQAQRE